MSSTGESMPKMVEDTFRKFDRDGNGKITRDELSRVLKSISGDKQFSDGDIKALFDASDTNKDGFIDYKEFVRWVTGDQAGASGGDQQDFAPIDKRGGATLDYRKFLPERFDVSVSDRYNINKTELGAGGFGTVFVAKDKECEGRVVAVKKVQKPRQQKDLADLENEIKVMKDMDHPSICKLLARFEEGNSMYFVMELCTGGEVFDRIIETGSISEHVTATIIRQVTEALAHAHSRGVAHRDIKPENVVFCTSDRNDLSVKVIDWGLAASIDEGLTKAVGSMTYAAPEVINSRDKKQYSEACDLWSLGVMTYVMLCGKPPFWGSREQHYKSAIKEHYPFKEAPWDAWGAKPPYKPPKDFVFKLLKAKPQERLPIKDALQHPWLTTDKPAVDVQVSLGVLKNLDSFRAQSTFKKMCITAVARQLDHKQLKDIHQVFRDIDANGDGVLSCEEVQKGFSKIPGCGIDQKELADLFNRMDLDGSKSIDYTEFCAAGLDAATSTADDVIWAAFKVFDQGNTGYIRTDDLKKILDAADTKDTWSESVCKEVGQEIVSKYDNDGDGKISFDEFRSIMKSCYDKSKASSTTASGPMGAYDILHQVNSLSLKDLEKIDLENA